jgi:5'-3' exonuclease
MACENRYKTATGYTMISPEPLEFTPEEDAIYLEKAWIRFQEIVKDLCEKSYTDQYRMAVKGDGNFRNDIYPEYKANRHADPKKRNPFVPLLRKRAADVGMAVEAHGMEADDLLRIFQQEAIGVGDNYVICSIDKDLKCIPGRHYLMHKNEFLNVSEEEAIRFFYEQLLKGDSTDNIKGIPGVGEVKARRYLEPDTTEEDFQHTIIKSYQIAFGKDWKKELLLNGKLLYLKKHFHDEFNLEGWPDVPYLEEEKADKPEKVSLTIPEQYTNPKPREEDNRTWTEMLGWGKISDPTGELEEEHNRVEQVNSVDAKRDEEVSIPNVSAFLKKKVA